MQALILLYHYTGASKVLWAYKMVRILAASYLFLAGYGHTQYFLTTGDFTFKRVCGVLVRLNLLSVLLADTMETDYSLYYCSHDQEAFDTYCMDYTRICCDIPMPKNH